MSFIGASAKIWLWKQGQVVFENNWKFASEGGVLKNREISGWLQWELPGRDDIRWSTQGVWGESLWRPENQWMEEWLTAHPDYLQKNPLIDFKIKPTEKKSGAVKSALRSPFFPKKAVR